MNLENLLYKLSYGELRNLSMAEEEPGKIRDRDIPSIVQYINDGLIKLHGRYDLKIKDIILETYKHITFYHLKSTYAESQQDTSPEDFFYIKDLHREPFTDDVLKVKQVVDNYGCALPLNNSTEHRSVFTPQPLLLQVPFPKDGEFLTVLYKAKHEPLNEVPDLTQEVDVPDVLQVALRSYVASKVFGTIGTAETAVIAATHNMNYEAACLEIDQLDLVNSSVVNSGIRFHLNSWS